LSGTAVYGNLLWCASHVTWRSVSWNVWGIVTLEGNASLEGEELSSTSIDWAGWISNASTVGLGVGAVANLVKWVTGGQDVLSVASWVGAQRLAHSGNTGRSETTLGTR